MSIKKKVLSLLIVLSMVLSVSNINIVYASQANIYNTPAQIAVNMTSDPQHSVTITWTTVHTNINNANVGYKKTGADEPNWKYVQSAKEIRAVSNSNIKNEEGGQITQKAFYTATITGLTPNTKYQFFCEGIDSDQSLIKSGMHYFKTALEKEDEAYSFIYLADAQSSSHYGKSAVASSSVIKEMYPDASFIYIAGDITDTSTNEGQWETLFNQAGSSVISNKYQNGFSDYVIAAVQGNHDNNTFTSHMSFPESAGPNSKLTYAYNYGPAKYIMLNMEADKSATGSRDEQEAFLRKEVAAAKAEGKWTIVGFHKSIYTGASHITDSDVINARKYWSPIFAELDVDIVLQGHDHVLSRGFIDATGTKADVTTKIADRTYTAKNPKNAPLYYVGNCASTLKFYSAINYNISEEDPLIGDYAFLDINSVRPVAHVQNPDGPQTDLYQGPTFTAVIVAKDSINFKTYMFKYDTPADNITEKPFLYDNFTVTRKVENNQNPPTVVDEDGMLYSSAE